MIKSDLEKLSKSELITWLLEQDEKKNKPDAKPVIDDTKSASKDGEKEEMRVGKKQYRPNLYAIYGIRKQESNRFLLDRLCDKARHGEYMFEKEGSYSFWGDNGAPDSFWESDDTPYSFWESDDTLYSSYEICNKCVCSRCFVPATFVLVMRIEGSLNHKKSPICNKCYERYVTDRHKMLAYLMLLHS